MAAVSLFDDAAADRLHDGGFDESKRRDSQNSSPVLQRGGPVILLGYKNPSSGNSPQFLRSRTSLDDGSLRKRAEHVSYDG